ncbi:hypothetical protein ACRPFF_11705, partial [Neisseria sp. SLRRB23]|uniref:hypothetical protein n=1 Tax=Neisseria sp. SLRRB23 TaxID=3435199 RepID=UPI003D7FFDB6
KRAQAGKHQTHHSREQQRMIADEAPYFARGKSRRALIEQPSEQTALGTARMRAVSSGVSI